MALAREQPTKAARACAEQRAHGRQRAVARCARIVCRLVSMAQRRNAGFAQLDHALRLRIVELLEFEDRRVDRAFLEASPPSRPKEC